MSIKSTPQGEYSRVGLYARVSTANGHQDPEMQLTELREYATDIGLEISREYVDHGVSGSKESRSGIKSFREYRLSSQLERMRPMARTLPARRAAMRVSVASATARPSVGL